MEMGLQNNEGRTPPRRRRRGACEGCKQSKVRCDGNTPCEYCMKYSRTCLYHHSSTRRHRRQSSSSSLCLSSTNSAPATIEPHNEMLSLQPNPASAIFDFDFGQCPADEPLDDLFKDLLPSIEDPWYDLLNHSGPFTSDWDLATLKATEVVNIREDDTNTKNHSYISESNLGIHYEIAVASTAGESANLSRTCDQENNAHDAGKLDIKTRNFVVHRGILKDEEVEIVDSALKQLHNSILLDCKTTPRSETSQKEVWKRLLEEEWRETGIRAAFDVYTSLGDFLCETDIKILAEEVLTHSQTESLSVVLVLGVIAVGRHVIECQTTTLSVVSLGESQQIFTEACTRVKPFLLGHNSLLKLQALISLAVMSIRINDTISFDLISHAGTCMQTLHGSQGTPDFSLNSRREEKRQVDLNLATCALHCLEYQFNTSNVNPVNNTRPFLPLSADEDFHIRWMEGQIEYIKIFPYGQEKDSQGDIRDMVADLQKWKSTLPVQYHDVDQPFSPNVLSDGRKLWVFCQYHEAILRLDMKEEKDAFDILGGTKHGFHSAGVILEATSLLPSSVVLANRKVYELVSLATRFIFNAVLRDPGSSAQANLRYLGMACGFFARLSLINPFPFDATTLLLCVAQKVTKRPKLLKNMERSSVDEQPLFSESTHGLSGGSCVW